jgi:hypothetical protein
MPDPGNQNSELSVSRDPFRHFENAEPWATSWQYRFLPPTYLRCLSVSADHGLENLLYFQTLICDEADGAATATATS